MRAKIRWNKRGWRTRRWTVTSLGSKRWWLCFAAGIMLAVMLKGIVYINDLEPASVTSDKTAAQQAEQRIKGQEISKQNIGKRAENPGGEKDKAQADQASAPDKLEEYDHTRVAVYLEKEKKIEKVPLELYVRGVIAGEMPIDFELEALKAQAIAARTYIYRRLSSGDHSGMDGIQADVRNTIQHQVYIPLEELLHRWKGEEKEQKLAKLNRAVEETKGMIVTYAGEPIQATFFSTSNGYTENASDYWSSDIPYLRSVTSPWDQLISPRYKEVVNMKLKTVAQKLGVTIHDVKKMRVLETTEGKRVKALTVGKKELSGREVREKLGLASSQFNWSIDGDEVEITTYGFGHGVGMSQWGANGMAQEGKKAEEILSHYYSGTKVEKAPKLELKS